MTIVQDPIFFIEGKKLVEYYVDPMSVHNVTNEEVLRGLMKKAPTIISREMIPKHLCIKVDEKVSIPRVIQGVVEELFVGEIHIDR
jgi:hypothetical protein